jgi:hypothetical protein
LSNPGNLAASTQAKNNTLSEINAAKEIGE